MSNLGTTGKLVLAFVTLLIGIVLVGVIATQGLVVTDKLVITDEAQDIASAREGGNTINSSIEFTITNPPTSWKSTDCPLTSITLGNDSTDFTVTTDYVITDSTGVFSLVNSTAWIGSASNTSNIDYTYCGDDYMNLSWGRTLINLIAGFFAIAILMVSLGLFYSIAKDTGVI